MRTASFCVRMKFCRRWLLLQCASSAAKQHEFSRLFLHFYVCISNHPPFFIYLSDALLINCTSELTKVSAWNCCISHFSFGVDYGAEWTKLVMGRIRNKWTRYGHVVRLLIEGRELLSPDKLSFHNYQNSQSVGWHKSILFPNTISPSSSSSSFRWRMRSKVFSFFFQDDNI